MTFPNLLIGIIAVVLGVLAARLIDMVKVFTGDARVGLIILLVWVVAWLIGYGYSRRGPVVP